MTREEAIRFLKRDHCWKGVPPDTQMAIETLMQQPSLPSNLDDAARDIVCDAIDSNDTTIIKYEGLLRYLVKAGAEWMAGQGVSTDGEVIISHGNKTIEHRSRHGIQETTIPGVDIFDIDDKVIVQIRKAK